MCPLDIFDKQKIPEKHKKQAPEKTPTNKQKQITKRLLQVSGSLLISASWMCSTTVCYITTGICWDGSTQMLPIQKDLKY